MSSIKNPLHQHPLKGNISAQPLEEETEHGLSGIDVAEEIKQEQIKKCRRLFWVGVLILVPYLCISGLSSLVFDAYDHEVAEVEAEETTLPDQYQPIDEYKKSIGFFARFFCSGNRRALSCR